MSDTQILTWESDGKVRLTYAVIYGPQPRWWWCRYLPKSWRWAWPERLIAYSDLTADKSTPRAE